MSDSRMQVIYVSQVIVAREMGGERRFWETPGETGGLARLLNPASAE